MLPFVLTRTRLTIGIALAASLLLLGTYLLLTQNKEADTAPVTEEVRVQPLPATIELADTPEKRTQGLSGRELIPDDYGMLFIFTEDGYHRFWMKEMLVPIDIIWTSEAGTIVYIEHSASPTTYPDTFGPSRPARYVLETRAGYARESGWEVGTLLDLSTYQK